MRHARDIHGREIKLALPDSDPGIFLRGSGKYQVSGKTYLSYLVRESFRTPDGPRSRTVCNITDLLLKLGQQIHRTVMTQIPKILNEQIQKLGLAPLFAAPPRL